MAVDLEPLDCLSSGRRRPGRRILPSGRALPAQMWESRHRAIMWLLWAHLPVLFLLGVLRGYPPLHVALDLGPVVIAATCAFASFPREWRAAIATFGLVACSALLIHMSGGVIEMHFHFFVVVGIVSLYQDWIPFGVAIGFTVVEHAVVGVFAPESVYNHSAAQTSPVLWAAIHGTFVLAAGVPSVLAWRQNEELTLRDPLTRLANRTLITDRLQQALDNHRRRGTPVALLFLDLDLFKEVNDTLGHATGDDLLVEFSSRLHECVRPHGTVGRLGGDEFAVILEGDSAGSSEAIAQRLLDLVAVPARVGDRTIAMKASIGIARASTGSTMEQMLRHADFAMYAAKSSGRGRFNVYDDAMHTRAIEGQQLEADLRQAVERGDITIACQPVFHLVTGRMVGAEVLARWTHAERGPVPPNVFVPVAERTGLICAIGDQVFVQACRVAQQLAPIDPRFSLSINLSPVQLNEPDLSARLAGHLADHAVRPDRIVLEVTETVVMQDAAVAAHKLADLKRIGVDIAIDDFGVGNSSLSALRSLPVDILKIDKSFIDAFPSGAEVASLMIQLGKTLGLHVVAEGVETTQQRDELTSMGCPLVQGFLFARPMAPAALLAAVTTAQVAALIAQTTVDAPVQSIGVASL